MTDTASINEALSANYLLVDLELRSWSGKKTDKLAGEEITTSKGATKDGAKVIKFLFASADAELAEVGKAGQAVRQFVYSQTLPWSSAVEGAKRGSRLLAATSSFEFLRELNQVKAGYDKAVAALAAVWDTRKAEAIKNLGGLADANDYPDAGDVPALFGTTVDLRPVPSQSDFSRIAVPTALATALGERHAKSSAVHVEVAMAELKEKLLECLNRMANQLGKAGKGEKTRLYDSLVTNLQGMVSMCRTMNVTGNAGINELADRIERELLAKPVEVFRNSKAEAAVVADAAQQIAMAAAVEDMWKVL